MFCMRCGTENQDGAKFCRKCGLPIEPPKSPESQKSPVPPKKKKSNVGLIILIVAMLLALIIAIFFAIRIASGKKSEKHSKNENTKYEALMEDANKYLEDVDYEKAEAAYLDAIAIDPKQAEPYLKLVDVYQGTGEVKKAKEILKQGVDATSDPEVKREYAFYEVILPEKEDGTTEEWNGVGTYELSYTTHVENLSVSAHIIPAEGVDGLVNYRIKDLDQDGEDEMLAVYLEPVTRQQSGNEYKFYLLDRYTYHQLHVKVYEYLEGELQLQDDFHPEGCILGYQDQESSGVFLQESNGQTYICGGLFGSNQTIATGCIFDSFVLTYDGAKFQYYTGTNGECAGSEFSGMRAEAEDMAAKLDAIGLPKAAAAIREWWMMAMTYDDDMSDVLFRVEGNNVGGDGMRFMKTYDVNALGKVIVQCWKDTKEP